VRDDNETHEVRGVQGMKAPALKKYIDFALKTCDIILGQYMDMVNHEN
jgi:hypothetical protein